MLDAVPLFRKREIHSILSIIFPLACCSLLHESASRKTTSIIFRQTFSLFAPSTGNKASRPELRHSRSRSSLSESPHSLHAEGRRSLEASTAELDSPPRSSPSHRTQEYTRAYHKAKMSLSFAGAGNGSVQTRNGDEIAEIVVEVRLASRVGTSRTRANHGNSLLTSRRSMARTRSSYYDKHGPQTTSRPPPHHSSASPRGKVS